MNAMLFYKKEGEIHQNSRKELNRKIKNFERDGRISKLVFEKMEAGREEGKNRKAQIKNSKIIIGQQF